MHAWHEALATKKRFGSKLWEEGGDEEEKKREEGRKRRREKADEEPVAQRFSIDKLFEDSD